MKDVPTTILPETSRVLFARFNAAIGETPWTIQNLLIASDSQAADARLRNLQVWWNGSLVASPSLRWQGGLYSAEVPLVIPVAITPGIIELTADVPSSAAKGIIRVGIAESTPPPLAGC